MNSVYSTASQLALDFVAAAFLIAGGFKLLNWNEFRVGLLYVPYVGVKRSYAIALTLPIVEIMLVIALIFQMEIARYGILALLVLFFITTCIVIRHNLVIPCNCFGFDTNRVYSWKTARDILILCFLVLIGKFSAEEWPYRVESLLFAFFLLVCIPIIGTLLKNNTLSRSRTVKGQFAK